MVRLKSDQLKRVYHDLVHASITHGPYGIYGPLEYVRNFSIVLGPHSREFFEKRWGLILAPKISKKEF